MRTQRFGAETLNIRPRKRYAFPSTSGGPSSAYDEAAYGGDEGYPDEGTSADDPWGYGGGSSIPANLIGETFKDRIHTVWREETDPMHRALRMCFFGQPAVHGTLANILARDDVFPFGFLLFRPYMTYAMASAILTVAGSATGETLVGHADFQLADNVNQKMHVGHFTMHLKSVVYQPHHVWIADNVMAQGYIGGNNCTWRHSGHNTHVTDVTDASMYSCLVPYDCPPDGGRVHAAFWESEIPNPIDITGSYSSAPSLAALASSSRGMHYATSRFYARMHNWSNSSAGMDETSMGLNNSWNTICFQGHQAMFNVRSKLYDLVRANTGHRGERIYAGCGRVWRGLAKLLEPVNFVQEHGGAPVRTITTMGV
jgi:hypothetical protein